MGFYDKYILPPLLNTLMKSPDMTKIRSRLVPLAQGKVLEVGIGSGLNLPFYDSSVQVTAVDPSLELQRYAREVAAESGVKVDFVAQSGEAIPAGDASFDAVVMTWTLCTIPDPMAALAEIKRVLKPNGRVLFAEHGKAPAASLAKWQDRLNPLWGKLSGGCNLNRVIDQLYTSSGFQFEEIERSHIRGPKFATYTFRGVAKLA